MHILATILGLLMLAASAGAESSTNVLLTNVVDALALPGERAWGFNVRIRGVVTAAQPSTALQPNWDGGMFVQDGTGGIYALAASRQSPQPGDWVEITGSSHPGGFAPFINDAQWTKLGTAPLPPAKSVPVEQLMSGVEDSQRVEISGVVRSGLDDPPMVMYEIVSGGYRLKAFAPPLPGVDLQTLVGAKVRVRGTASTFYSGLLRQLISVELHVPFPSDFVIEKMQPEDPFHSPVVPLSSLGQYRRGRELGERVHIKGAVTYQRRGQDLFLQDATRGIQVRSRGLAPVAPDDIVEAVGFLEFENFLPVLEDATYRKSSEPPEKAEPKATPLSELQAGYRHAELIRLQGRVVDYVERQAGDTSVGKGEPHSVLTLQHAGVVFTVEGFASEPNQALARIPIGSTVEVDGVCFMSIADDGKLKALQVLLPGAKDVRILKKPDWLTPHRLLIGLTILMLVLLVAVSWIVMVQRRNRALKNSIAEKTKVQQELQESHNLLEWRVAERTKQLKVEMSARQEAEVQFKATLTERTRLAQELHDTLEQSLTGIGLQLDTAAKLMPKDPAAGNRHIGLARNQMTQSQLELRRSIWDLRSRELEQFDFPTALRVNAQQITEGTQLKLEMETAGRVRALSEVTEDNLLRISQAALTNVIKHASASAVKITLQFGERDVTLRISDNGCGFTPENCPGSAEGHFGLVGMAERAKRLGGLLQVTSAPGSGTCLAVGIPIKPLNRTDAEPTTESQEPK
jgi:signal transduction histidine kinase